MREAARRSWGENHADALRLAEMLWHIHGCPVPVIARVQGDCYAGAMGLVAASDIAVAADDARFCVSEVKLGLLPATISPYLIRAIGERQARRWFLTAERFGAAQAQAVGLVHEVCAPGDLDARVDALLAALCANAPLAVRRAKQLIAEVSPAALTPELREQTAQVIADVRSGLEAQAGLASFLDKKRPPWQEPPQG